MNAERLAVREAFVQAAVANRSPHARWRSVPPAR